MNDPRLYFRLLGYVRPYRYLFALALIGILGLALTEPLLPALVKPLLDGSFVAKDPVAIAWMPLILLSVFIVRGIAGFVGTIALRAVAYRVVTDLRRQMFDKLLHLPTRRFDDLSAGVLISKLTYDVNQVMTASTHVLVTLVRDSVTVLGLSLWILYLNWKLSLVVLLIAPMIVVIVRVVGQRIRRLSRKVQEAMGGLNQVVDETLRGHRVIKVFGGHDYEAQRFAHFNDHVRRCDMKVAIASEASVPLIQCLAAVALAGVIYMASLQSLDGTMTVGGFVSLFGAMAMLLNPIKRLTTINEQLQRGLAAANSVFTLIDEPSEPDYGTHTPKRAQGHIEFRDVTLRYHTSEEPAIQQVCLTVQPGETIALVGPSGSGKTSLMSLLPRFYEVNRGTVLLDGRDIRHLTLAYLRAQIAYVGQDTVLFNDTVAANIRYGANRSVSEADIQDAAESAYALHFIRALPNGFQTFIGENGVKLSGGQRQRIAIARALLRNAPILILDEATSALDTESERQVQAAFDRLRQGRTAFIIAHRLSTIENADRIVVLQQGEIAEIGTHHTLMSHDGVYARLYRHQGIAPTHE